MDPLFPTLNVLPSQLKTDGTFLQDKLPEGALTHIIAGNGSFLVKRHILYDAVVKEEKSSLPDVSSSLHLKVPKITYTDFKVIEAFFREIYKLHKSEAAVILYAHPEGWVTEVPEQTVRGLSVHYNRQDMPRVIKRDGREYLRFGTIHSHANISAFHSGVDDADEKHIDGFHVTIGHVDQPNCSYSCRFMIHGTEFTADIKDWVDFPKVEAVTAPEKWVKLVSSPPYTAPTYTSPHSQYRTPNYPYQGSHHSVGMGGSFTDEDPAAWYDQTYGTVGHHTNTHANGNTKKGDNTPSMGTAGTSTSLEGKSSGYRYNEHAGGRPLSTRLTGADINKRKFEKDGFYSRSQLELHAAEVLVGRNECNYKYPTAKDVSEGNTFGDVCFQCAFYKPGKLCTRVFGMVSPFGICNLYQDSMDFTPSRLEVIDSDLISEERLLGTKVPDDDKASAGSKKKKDKDTEILVAGKQREGA